MATRHTDRAVMIEWTDAQVTVDGEMPICPIMTSYGVIVHKDRDRVCIASLIGVGGEPRVITAIPISLIKRTTVLAMKNRASRP